LGLRYVLLRKEFWERKRQSKNRGVQAKNILVTLGGSDPDNVTSIVIEALEHLNNPNLNVTVIVGGNNPHYKSLVKKVQAKSNFSVKRDVSDMPSLMNWADMAISGAGSTCWELLFMKVPFIAIILAENQKAIAQDLHRKGAALNMGWYSTIRPEILAGAINKILLSSEYRGEMISKQERLISKAEPDGLISQMV
jgi:spore coat polysaccharide biosynthesis predicted glycosyltransferase SpsG